MRNVRVLWKLWVSESIFGDEFTIGSRINALTAHAQTLSSQKPSKTVSLSRNDCVFICAEFKYDVRF